MVVGAGGGPVDFEALFGELSTAYLVLSADLVIVEVNQAYLRLLQVGALATAVLATVEQTAQQREAGLRVLRWSNAGHPPPLLIEPDGTSRLLTGDPDLLLGIDPRTGRTDHSLVLPPGATVLLYSDGLVERRGASIDDGLAWLLSATHGTQHRDLDRLCDQLLDEVAGSAEDDIALLVMRAHPEDRPRPDTARPTDVGPDSTMRG